MINYKHSPSLCCLILQWDNSNQIKTMCNVELAKITQGLLLKQNKYQALTEMKSRPNLTHNKGRQFVHLEKNNNIKDGCPVWILSRFHSGKKQKQKNTL